MAKYKNKKTGAIIETNCKISGENWIAVKGKDKAKNVGKTADSENGTPDGGTDNE